MVFLRDTALKFQNEPAKLERKKPPAYKRVNPPTSEVNRHPIEKNKPSVRLIMEFRLIFSAFVWPANFHGRSAFYAAFFSRYSPYGWWIFLSTLVCFVKLKNIFLFYFFCTKNGNVICLFYELFSIEISWKEVFFLFLFIFKKSFLKFPESLYFRDTERNNWFFSGISYQCFE